MNGSRLRLAMAPPPSTTLRPAHVPLRTMLAQAVSVQQLSTSNDPLRGVPAGTLVAGIVCLIAVACCVA